MSRRWTTGFAISVLFSASGTTAAQPDTPASLAKAVVASPTDARIVARAVELLPARTHDIVLIDATALEPPLRETVLKLDAFITKEGRSVYVTRHNAVLAQARQGSRFYLYVLASIIWHEMAHLDGADETEAQRREVQLWKRFMQDGRVDQATGLQYLQLLKKRHVS